jgi:CubicO group peptidase (beta-lactamase class C family)
MKNRVVGSARGMAYRAVIAALVLGLVTALPAAAAPPPTLDAKGQGALSSFLTGAVSRGDVPGVVVLVAAPDRVLYHEAFGKMNVAQDVDMRKDAIFRIASMTKPLT